VYTTFLVPHFEKGGLGGILQNLIHYQIQAQYPESHLLEVSCTIPNPNPKGQQLAMPAWIPGSYMIRDFAKNVVTLRAESQGTFVPVSMIDKSTWICDPVSGPLTLYYQVYCGDLAPRGAHVDNTHVFFNGSRVFLKVLGFEELPCRVDIVRPESSVYNHWRVATAMTRGIHTAHYEFGHYTAENYDELIDHPVEIGEFEVHPFKACGIQHEIIVTGKQKADINQLCTDVQKICEYQIQFFGEPVPLGNNGSSYVFLLTLLEGGYGGLEHRASCVLHARRENLPKSGESRVSDGYQSLLGLFSHEYFHTWNVKRIKPEAFLPYNLTQENYTKQLWIFEGITSYYDELTLIRTKRISLETYLEIVSRVISDVLSSPGRLKQTLEQSSFEAWTKFYKPDENTQNASISYYTKGSLVALALDLTIRRETNNQCSLDAIMKALWKEYGLQNKGLPEGAFEALANRVSGCNLKPFFDQALRSTEDLALTELFVWVGIQCQFHPRVSIEELGGKNLEPGENENAITRPLLEIKLKTGVVDAQIAYVWSGSSAEAAGIAANDLIIAVNGFKVDRARFESVIGSYSVGEEITIHAFRRDELMIFKVTLRASSLQRCVLKVMDTRDERQSLYLNDWLEIV